MTNKVFKPNYWGSLRQFEIPHSIVQNEKLTLKPAGLSVLLVLYESGAARQGKNPGATVLVKITQNLLMERTGYTKNVITAAVKELEEAGFIQRSPSRKKRGEFGSNEYTLLNPSTGAPLEAGGRNFLYGNSVQYIKMPVCIVKEHQEKWSLARMESSERRVYVAICWLANRKNRSTFDFTLRELKSLGGFATLGTVKAAFNGLAERALLSVQDEVIILNDPYTGEPLHVQDGDSASDPANYSVKDDKGRERRWNLNTGDSEHIERLLQQCGVDVIPQKSGELAILCPFHPDNNPSCFVNPMKRVFYCQGCRAKGTVTNLVMKLRDVNKGTALKLVAEASGVTVEFREPDSKAEAKYSYYDAKGKLVKQVLRYPGKEFKQRRPAKNGGWIWDIKGVPPLLYNVEHLRHADVVCVCEGEKDCETIQSLTLRTPSGGDVCATTSGNAESWSDELADHLKNKRVVVMPDADQAGERFGAEIVASLEARDIKYRVISFRDKGAKDVSEFLAKGGTKKKLAGLIGSDWVRSSEPSVYDPDEIYQDPDAPLVTP